VLALYLFIKEFLAFALSFSAKLSSGLQNLPFACRFCFATFEDIIIIKLYWSVGE
jgi:hypothetical protein